MFIFTFVLAATKITINNQSTWSNIIFLLNFMCVYCGPQNVTLLTVNVFEFANSIYNVCLTDTIVYNIRLRNTNFNCNDVLAVSFWIPTNVSEGAGSIILLLECQQNPSLVLLFPTYRYIDADSSHSDRKLIPFY